MAQCTPKSFDLTGKVALITGASYGIGMAIAKAMAANGATIVFNDIKQELVDKGIAAYEEAGIKAHGYVCDVTDEDAVNAMVAKITEEVGHINILVNNARKTLQIPVNMIRRKYSLRKKRKQNPHAIPIQQSPAIIVP